MRPPKPKSPKVMRAIKRLAGPMLVKFSKRKYMEELLLKGRGRISPASSFMNDSLGYARADNESHITGYLDRIDAFRFMVVDGDTTHPVGSEVAVPYLGSVPIDIRANIEFYIYCLADSLDPRLFDDFEADVCVIIKHAAQFKDRVRGAVTAILPGWRFVSGPVVYFDPFFCPVHQTVPHFWKHFRFGYQEEHRLAWLPPAPDRYLVGQKFGHVYFDVGPLTDIATLLWI
jgi:hypothetical protein